MKQAQRIIYLELASEIDGLICDFCHYSRCQVGESLCDCGEPYCVHPLKDRLESSVSSYGLSPGDDCWGFRPAHSVGFCADIVGIMLQKKWESARWCQDKHHRWKIAEIKV